MIVSDQYWFIPYPLQWTYITPFLYLLLTLL